VICALCRALLTEGAFTGFVTAIFVFGLGVGVYVGRLLWWRG
jgi:hypothetical protein